MSENESRAGADAAQRIEDGGLGLGVHGGGGVVQDQNSRLDEKSAGQRDALALSSGQGESALTDEAVVSLGQGVDEGRGLRQPRRMLDLLRGGVGPAESDVGGDGVGEEERLVEHQRDGLAQGCRVEVVDIDRRSVGRQGDLSLSRAVEAREQECECGLSRTRVADDGHRLTGRDGQVQAGEHLAFGLEPERHLGDADSQRAVRQRDGFGRFRVGRLGIDHLVDALDGRAGELSHDHHRRDGAGHGGQSRDIGGEGQKRADRDVALEGQIAAEGDDSDESELRNGGHRRCEPRVDLRRSHALGEQRASQRLDAIHRAGFLSEALHHSDAGDGFLDMLCQIGGALLRRPGGREERGPNSIDHDADRRNDEYRDHGEQRRQIRHHRQRQHELQDGSCRQRHHGQQSLHELEVGDRSRDHLPGSDLVLLAPVEPLQ